MSDLRFCGKCVSSPVRQLAAMLGVAVWALGVFCAGDEASFRVHVVNRDSAHNSCAAMDVDRDGRLDIVAGAWWYQAPDWSRHFAREVEMIRGRYDDYSHLPVDVNGDGWLDLVSANYRSQSIYWVEHPGRGLGTWKTHVVDRPGAMETGRLADIDGDGQLDLLPNGLKFAAWWEFKHEAGATSWLKHELPSEISGHGVGFGDLNGDGRGDIVGPRGWLEAPVDPRRDRWVFRPDFSLDRDCSIPILIHDVDADGDNDIIWGRGHQIGLYWLEQQRASTGTGAARVDWVRHTIDTSWSQPHSILLADIDSNGKLDLVAGQRYMGHDGKDPGEFNPLVVYWYEFKPAHRVWRRHAITTNSPTGFGLDPKAADLDGDGDVDLIVADRNGLSWFENRHREGGPPAIEPESPHYDDHQHLLHFLTPDGTKREVRTARELGIRRAHILAGIQRAMGKLPSSSRRVPLDIKVDFEQDEGNYLRRKITYAAEQNDRVPAYLLIPKGLTAAVPGMLCLHQTTRIGKDEPAGISGESTLAYAHELASRGYVCIVPDYPSFGDYEFDFQQDGGEYVSGSMKAVWNNIRALDVLDTLEQVDRDRIGCIGHSLGAHNGLFTAVFDQRIRAVVTSCGFTAFHHYYDGNLDGWSSPRYMPRIRDLYQNDPQRVPFDFYEVLAAIAPRSVFVNAPRRDANFDVEGVKKIIDEVRKVYALRDSASRMEVQMPDTGHEFPDDVRQACYEWLDKSL